MQNRYNILQSGFISLENKHLISNVPAESDLEFDAYILNKPQKKDDNNFFYHKGIEELYREYMQDGKLGGDFHFQEKVLLEFFDALGTENLAGWLSLQKNSPYLTNLHQRFILDTLQFIKNGERMVQPENWMLLIDKDSSFDKKGKFNIDLDQHFNAQSTWTLDRIDKLPYYMPALIQNWLTRCMGFNDLLMTAKIIFGKTSNEKTVI